MDNEMFNKGIGELRAAGMTEAERASMRGRLVARAETVSVAPAARPSVRSPYVFILQYHRRALALALILVLVLTSGGTMAAAEAALPGDTLYPVKVGVTEPLRDVLAVGAVANIEWETEKAERRLQEAELLAVQGKLNSDTRAEVEERFEAHVAEIASLGEAAEADDDAETAVRARVSVEAVATAHARVIEAVSRHSEREQESELKTLEDRVRIRAIEAAKKREEFAAKLSEKYREDTTEAATSTSPAAGADARERREREIESAIKKGWSKVAPVPAAPAAFLTASSTSLNEAIMRDAERSLRTADEALKRAREKREAGEVNGEYESALVESKKAAREADVSAESVKKFERYEKKAAEKREKDAQRDRSDDRRRND